MEVVQVGGGVRIGEGVAESTRTKGEGGGAGLSEDIFDGWCCGGEGRAG